MCNSLAFPGRQKELAVRTAMGATRARIVRPITDRKRAAVALRRGVGNIPGPVDSQHDSFHMPPDVARLCGRLDYDSSRSRRFDIHLCDCAGQRILFRIAPSLLNSRTNISETLKESGRGASSGRARHRMRSAFVIAEVSLALVLLVGAGLLVKGFHALLTVNQTYHPETLLTFNFNLPNVQYPQPSARSEFHDRLLQSLASIPRCNPRLWSPPCRMPMAITSMPSIF